MPVRARESERRRERVIVREEEFLGRCCIIRVLVSFQTPAVPMNIFLIWLGNLVGPIWTFGANDID